MNNQPDIPRVLFALPGFHCVNRGAEVALENVAREMARQNLAHVTLIGSGEPHQGEPYAFIHAGRTPRERFVNWPKLPVLRHEYAWEEATWAPRLWRKFKPNNFDATVACTFPFTNWMLRLKGGDSRPAHVYVTQNGDYACQRPGGEYKYFACDGLVCTNPDYFERNKDIWPSVLIPNGVDPQRFSPRAPGCQRDAALDHAMGITVTGPRAIMVSAIIESKRVRDGIRAAARAPGLSLVVAGDGPLNAEADRLGTELMPGRFQRITLPRERMPDFYRSADAFLHMSKDEPSANAYIEALATGLPIVTHDRAVTRWTFEGGLASLVDSDDLNAVASALAAATQEQGRGVAARLELVQRRYTWSSIARQYATFISETIQRRTSPA